MSAKRKEDKQTLVLIDGNSLLNRAFFATPVFTTKEGLPTNGVFGFLKLLMKITSDIDPEYLIVTFDLHAPTFRHNMFDGYKAGRKPMPDELRVQVPVLKECLNKMSIRYCEMEGFEADDLIGTFSKKFDVRSIIYTGDRDAYQLVSENTEVYFTKRGVSDILELNNENFKEITGLTPIQIIDLKSLMGDKSDNIPGVAGIGEKSAVNLLQKYYSLENIYRHIDEISGAAYKKLTEGKEQAFLSKTLATINTAVPYDISLSDCVCPKSYSYDVKQKFAELEFKTFLNMNIFEEEKIDEAIKEDDAVAQLKVFSGGELSDFYGEISKQKTVYLLFDGSLRVYFGDTEYVFPIKENFFEEGYYFEELSAILTEVFKVFKGTVVTYKSKDLMHKLDEMGVSFSVKFEDVSLMKYLVDYTGKDDELDYVLTYYGMPLDKKAFSLYKVFSEYSKKLKEEEQIDLYYKMELPLIEVLYSMEREGVCVNESMFPLFDEKYESELALLTQQIYQEVGEVFNINSPSQLGTVLFEKMRLPGGKKGKNGKYSTSAEVLEKLEDDYEVVKKVLRFRQIQKLKSTYIEGLKPLVQNGKVHTTYNQVITATGRLSSLNPNVQNIPVRNSEGKELRKLFVASEANVLLDADYSQIELRLLAHFSGCKELIEAYNNDEDIHALTASQVFNVPLSEMTSEIRRQAKAVNFGIIYGISAFGLAKDLNISVPKAQDYINAYFKRYSAVKEYMDSNVSNAKKDGFITTLSGRKRVINELRSSNFNVRAFGERAAMNMPLQGSSADIIKIAMINVYNRLKEGNFRAKLILQVHDELVIDCPKEESEAVAEILKYEMENAVKLNVPLTVEVNTGNNWFEAK